MATRSRKGCIDCKQAKVKCDEVHPHCGTCARRRRVCNGYARSSKSSNTASNTGSVWVNNRSPIASGVTVISSRTSVEDAWLSGSMGSTADYMRLMISEASTKCFIPALGPVPMPLGEILAADKPLIEVYFMRHPSEMVFCNDMFIYEMNAAAFTLLQQSPTAVGDALAAIGENYVTDSPDYALMSSRKTRLLSRLRLVNEKEGNPELTLMLLLALCGVELVDPQSDGSATTLSVLIDNVAMVLAFHARRVKPLSSLSRYFARGLARQDLLISLTRMRRTRINPCTWLDDYSTCHADRVMGLTTTLFPMLSELAALAEDMQSISDSCTITYGVNSSYSGANVLVQHGDLLQRQACLRTRLVSWRPIQDRSISMIMSRALLFHAYSWRAAALLYLFRLFNRSGSSAKADEEALGMAYEVIFHISGPSQDVKLSLWPLFIAACELKSFEDRAHATQLFDDICFARPIATARHTRAFVVEIIWPTRDSGGHWDWMSFANRVPIPL